MKDNGCLENLSKCVQLTEVPASDAEQTPSADLIAPAKPKSVFGLFKMDVSSTIC